MKQKPIFWILPVVATLLTSCFVIPSTYRVQIDDPTGKKLESYYLLWWTHVGGVTAYWPSEVLFTQPDAEGKATVRLRIPTPKTYVLVLDREVDYYAASASSLTVFNACKRNPPLPHEVSRTFQSLSIPTDCTTNSTIGLGVKN